jgi:phosphopantetheine adenylyltransferase
VSERTTHSDLKNILLSFIEDSLKREELLNKARRETVIEMSLEPITGIRLTEYLTKLVNLIDNNSINDLNKLIEIVDLMYELYNNISKRVIYASVETSMLLENFSQVNYKRIPLLLNLKNVITST